MSMTGNSSGDACKTSRSSCASRELAPVRGRPTVGRGGRRFERLAQVRKDFLDQPRLGCKAISRMSLPQFGHSSENSSLSPAMSLAQAIREVS